MNSKQVPKKELKDLAKKIREVYSKDYEINQLKKENARLHLYVDNLIGTINTIGKIVGGDPDLLIERIRELKSGK